MLRKRHVPMEVLCLSFAVVALLPGPMAEVRRLELPRGIKDLTLTDWTQVTVWKPGRGGVHSPDALVSDRVVCVVHPGQSMHKTQVQCTHN